MTITRYPAGPITPAGAYHLLYGDKPNITYRSYDDAIVFHMAGGQAIYDRRQPESVQLLDIKGLIPPWQSIEQKGATQDGSTYITSLYDPLEVDMTVQVRGRDAAHTRQVLRAWIDSWDAKQPGELSWFTPEMGRWWTNVRWGKQPTDPIQGGTFTRQKLGWKATCYDAFWRSYDSVDVFTYSYIDSYDGFNRATFGDQTLGDDWTISYSGPGSGFLYCDGAAATSTLTGGRCAVARHDGADSGTDYQIVTLAIGAFDQWPAATDTCLDLWARMNNNGTPNTGIRARIGYHEKTVVVGLGETRVVLTPFIRLSYFVDGEETLLRQADVGVPFQPTDQISLAVGGYAGHARHYYVQRGTVTGNNNTTRTAWATLMSVVEIGTGSQMGADYRSAGFGMQADGTRLPPSVNMWTCGDSTAAEEGGYLSFVNAGDQPMWLRYLLVGPGLFGIGDGPNATSAAVFGPLYENQVVEIQTDPRVRGVVDLSSVPASPEQLARYKVAKADFLSFLRGQNAPPENASVFGIQPAQGNLYALLKGRFSRPIPAKPPGSAAQPYRVAVAIEGGSSQSAILASGTPLRRWPQ